MEKTKPNTIMVDGIEYIPSDQVEKKGSFYAEIKDDMEYVIIRAQSAGVFAGYLKNKKGTLVELVESRRLWKWVGAATCSQLAIDGVTSPSECKFPESLPRHTIEGVIEIIPCSEKSRISITNVPIWRV